MAQCVCKLLTLSYQIVNQSILFRNLFVFKEMVKVLWRYHDKLLFILKFRTWPIRTRLGLFERGEQGLSIHGIGNLPKPSLALLWAIIWLEPRLNHRPCHQHPCQFERIDHCFEAFGKGAIRKKKDSTKWKWNNRIKL